MSKLVSRNSLAHDQACWYLCVAGCFLFREGVESAGLLPWDLASSDSVLGGVVGQDMGARFKEMDF